MRDPKGVLDFGFMLDAHAIAPVHDILWHIAGHKGQAAFWRQAARVGHAVFSLQMAAGIDRMGVVFKRLKQSTIDRRRSAMTNHPDKYAPPFIPGHDLSRTVSYLRAKVMQNGVWFYWLMDKGLRKRWGQILDYHRRGMVPGAPVRDVFGFAPSSIARIKKEMGEWWKKNRVNLAHDGVGVGLAPGSNLAITIDRLGAIGQPQPQQGLRPLQPHTPPLPTPAFQPVTATVVTRMAGNTHELPRNAQGQYTGFYRRAGRYGDVARQAKRKAK
jgi:hypothetical protein